MPVTGTTVELDSGYRRIRDSRVGTTVVPSRTRERASVRTPTAVDRIVIWQVLMGSVLKIAVTNVNENANGSSLKVNAVILRPRCREDSRQRV